jgi:multisubunit Na+/H+ antiporter MnhB subunit
MRNNKKFAVLLLIIGLSGLIATGYFVMNAYFKSKNIGELLKPITIGFIPFFISFVVIRLSIGELTYKK